MLICHPVASRPLIFPQKEAVLSPCDHPFDSLHSEVSYPLNFATHETEDPSATPPKTSDLGAPAMLADVRVVLWHPKGYQKTWFHSKLFETRGTEVCA